MRVQQFLHDEQLEALPTDVDRTALAAATAATYVLHQDITYAYDQPVSALQQRLVVLPRRQHVDQRRLAQRIEVRTSGQHRLHCRTDRFGNPVLHVEANDIGDAIEFRTRVVVQRSRHQRTRPIWRTGGATTALTAPNAAIADAASSIVGHGATELAEAISELVHRSFEYRHDVTSVRTSAAEAWGLRQGVCQDMTHVAIAMCATRGVAARYVSGHLVGDGASHAWFEVLDPARDEVVALDPTHDRRVDLRYVTTATGRDYRDVAPTSGTYVSDGGRGRLTVRKRVAVVDLTSTA